MPLSLQIKTQQHIQNIDIQSYITAWSIVVTLFIVNYLLGYTYISTSILSYPKYFNIALFIYKVKKGPKGFLYFYINVKNSYESFLMKFMLS